MLIDLLKIIDLKNIRKKTVFKKHLPKFKDRSKEGRCNYKHIFQI